jgi:integrase
MKFTLGSIRDIGLPKGKKDHIEFDDDVPGFGLRIREGGSRSWIYQYRIGSKQRRMVLGNAKSVPLILARKNAGELEARVRLGEDPAGEKERARVEAGNTFGAFVAQYLEARKSEWRKRSAEQVRRHLLSHAKPLHSMPIASVSQANIAKLLNDVATNSGAVTANRVRASVAAMLSWLMREGIHLPAGNVAANTNKREERSRDRILSDGELKQIWNACRGDDYGAVIKLLALTGQRFSEIAGLQFDEMHDDQIILPGERTKNGRAHIIPLSEPARAILAGFPRTERKHVFGRDDTFGFRGRGAAKASLDQRVAGKPIADWTPHDLRRTVATRMAELGVQPHVIEAVLNHASGKSTVAGIYNRHSYDKGKREALNLWAEHVTALIEGRKAVVVPMKRA